MYAFMYACLYIYTYTHIMCIHVQLTGEGAEDGEVPNVVEERVVRSGGGVVWHAFDSKGVIIVEDVSASAGHKPNTVCVYMHMCVYRV
jgi:hypothetical protein